MSKFFFFIFQGAPFYPFASFCNLFFFSLNFSMGSADRMKINSTCENISQQEDFILWGFRSSAAEIHTFQFCLESE